MMSLVSRHLISLAALSGLVMACSSAPSKRLDEEQVRLKLESVSSDDKVKRYAQEEIRQATLQLRMLDQIQGSQPEQRAHQIYLIERSLEIATARADERHELSSFSDLLREYDQILLQASLREAEMSRREAERLRASNIVQQEETQRALQSAEAATAQASEIARQNAQIMIEAERARELAAARGEQAELALREAELANATAQALRKQLENMEGQQTQRGMMFTLGDVTFESGQAALRDNALDSLDKLVAFIDQQPGKSISIEGHTDNVGSDATNLSLSQERADNVKIELIRRGAAASRMDAVGLGEEFPVADNNSDVGRSQNRRVEVIILSSEDG